MSCTRGFTLRCQTVKPQCISMVQLYIKKVHILTIVVGMHISTILALY
jgi:hypothetical protein